MEKVRVGLIGTGVGIRILLPGFRGTGRADVVAVSSSSFNRAAAFAHENGIARAFEHYQDLCDCNELDLICVASPNAFHVEHGRAALMTDKYVLLEKPLAIDGRWARELAQLATGRRRWSLINHQLRFNPHFQELAAVLRRGELGRPYYLRICHQGTSWSPLDIPLSWLFSSTEGGGQRLAMGSHLVDLTTFLTGVQPCLVTCSMDPVHSERPDATGQPRGIRVSNAFSAQLDLQSGISVQLSATAAATSDTRFEVDILGSAGEAHFSLTNKLQIGRAGAPLSGVPVSGVSDAERTNAVPFFKGSFDYYAEAIVQSILSSDDSFVDAAATVESAVATQEVLDAMLISTRAGTRVEVASGYTSSTDV